MQEKNDILNTSIRYFKGVGPKKLEQLMKLGIGKAEDILYYLPARYEDRSNFIAIKDLKAGASQTIKGDIITMGNHITKTGARIFQIVLTDQTGFIHATWFNQPYLKDFFSKGQKVVLYGKVERYDKLQIVQPEYEILKGDEADSVHMGRIVPVYRAASQLTQRYLRGLAFIAVNKYCKFLTERLPTYILARQKLVDIRFAIRNIHFPTNFENLEKAYRRIVFEEFLMLQLALAMKRKESRLEVTGISHEVAGGPAAAFKKRLPFELTEGQMRAAADIERDMSSSKPMNRLLEGDVGSGKTVVAAYALTITVQNGFQGVLMAPTEILARQHFLNLSELLMPLGINVALLIGGIDQTTKKAIYSDIKEGKVNIVVGTHAVIQGAAEFKRLGLAVIDEQHKFGVIQRSLLKEKGRNPHVLVMTATPIPRTLALTIYGDLDISIIRELPKGRKPIVTYWVEEAKRGKVYDFIKEELAKGRQAYVICPLIDSLAQSSKPKVQSLSFDFNRDAKSKTQNVNEMVKKLRNEVFPEFEVGLLHGRMASKEKEMVMRDFKKGKTKILVSTIVIEVGIDITNASVMLIENAERFGLAQLHQLRGRIGRGDYESYCILLSNPGTDEAEERLKTIEGTVDGFQIAEADLALRGPGEFFGTRQHGLPEIRFGNILKDFGIMELARKEAFGLVARDPDLEEEHHELLKEGLASRFQNKK
ncbi:MAG: ATP-dependent DNA helicase RecG [Candidatus Omnitrophota bacterium]|nr:ATP-dependent DNA helicase RecG [Candidatus Omnitrophota bacterium]